MVQMQKRNLSIRLAQHHNHGVDKFDNFARVKDPQDIGHAFAVCAAINAVAEQRVAATPRLIQRFEHHVRRQHNENKVVHNLQRFHIESLIESTSHT